MKTHEFSFNSRADLERQITAFTDQNRQAKLDETQVGRARTCATELDNDGNGVGERITLRIDYTDPPS
jgi:hypothetical protein